MSRPDDWFVTLTPHLPPELLHGPFTLDDARRAGLERWHLEGSSWKRLGSGCFIWKGISDSPTLRLYALRRTLPEGVAFSGLTAAWLHGFETMFPGRIEVTVPRELHVERVDMAVRRRALPAHHSIRLRGLPVTSVLRTLTDLCARLPLSDAGVVADTALHKRRISLDELRDWVDANPGRQGVTHMRRVLEYVEPASESPMETRLRMTLVLARLPRPRAQVSIHDASGRFAGRPDLYYPDERLGIEYDGAVHKDSLAADNRRQNRLLGAGVRLLRFTASDVLSHPDSVVTQVKEMLGAAHEAA